jgi:hypothetical protein
MDTKDWLQLAGILFTVIIGQYFGVKLALRRFHSERWWELQMQTYAKALEQLAIVKHCDERRLAYTKHPDYERGPVEELVRLSPLAYTERRSRKTFKPTPPPLRRQAHLASPSLMHPVLSAWSWAERSDSFPLVRAMM